MIGYNPNRDSGIAEPRSYVEIGKDSLQGLVEEYDFVPVATQRYFAQLVYNVGPGGGGGGGEFTPTEVTALKNLSTVATALMGIASANTQEYIIDFGSTTIEESDINVYNKLIAVEYDETQKEYRAIPVSAIHDDSYEYSDFIINISGYVCDIECYNWMDEEHTRVSPTTERLLPKITYNPTIGEYGKTTIFLDQTYEYNAITGLPAGKQILKISYMQLPSKGSNNS